MNGTGTQADPFIITSVADLYSMETLGGPEVYFELGADIDINGTPYAEHFTPIPLNCLSLDGKGHSIKNIFISDPNNSVTVFSITFQDRQNISIRDLTFSNTRLAANGITFFNNSGNSNSTISLYNCKFFIEVNLRDRCCVMSNRIALIAELCSFSFSGILRTSSAFFGGDTLRRCHVFIDFFQITGPYYGFNNTDVSFFGGGCTISDSYITGSVTAGADFPNQSAVCMTARSSNFSNFYSAVEFTSVPICLWDGTYYNACFYDRELAGMDYTRGYTDQYQCFLPLTTAQCKDASYLSSIGFVVEGGD